MKHRDICDLARYSLRERGLGMVTWDIAQKWKGVRVGEFSLLSRLCDPIHREVYEVLLKEYIHERALDLR